MSINESKNFIEKIKYRAERSLEIEEVPTAGEIYLKTIDYLKKQKFLKFSQVEKILSNNFLSDYPLGYIIKDKKNEIVGFMGTIFSRRNLNKKEYIFCNIHSWIVDEEHRINSFLLLTPLIEKKYTLTAFTPVKSLVGLLEKFEFKKINMKYVVTFNFGFFAKQNNFILEKNDSEIKNKLSNHDLEIYKNYHKIDCEKFMILNKNDPSRNIFILAAKTKKKGFNILNFFYISNIEEFRSNWKNFKSNILREFNVNFCSQYFFDDSDLALPKNMLFKKQIYKEICIKDFPRDMKLNIVYSDLIS